MKIREKKNLKKGKIEKILNWYTSSIDDNLIVYGNGDSSSETE